MHRFHEAHFAMQLALCRVYVEKSTGESEILVDNLKKVVKKAFIDFNNPKNVVTGIVQSCHSTLKKYFESVGQQEAFDVTLTNQPRLY